jgi:hypothetical protein
MINTKMIRKEGLECQESAPVIIDNSQPIPSVKFAVNSQRQGSHLIEGQTGNRPTTSVSDTLWKISPEATPTKIRMYKCRACGASNPMRVCPCRGHKQDTWIGRESERSHHNGDLKWKTGRFIGIDGEGTTETGENRRLIQGGIHSYNLLVAYTPDGPEYIEDYENGLTTQQCFDFLLLLGKRYPNDIFVIYAGNYDFNMMLGDATRDNIAHLWATRDDDTNYTAIRDSSYEVSFLPKKYYRIRKVLNSPRFILAGGKKEDGTSRYKRNVESHILIWDVVGFFQATFVAALEGYKIASPDLIKDMKQRRKEFTPDDKDIIREYCFSECEHLVQLMDKLRDALEIADIHPSRWDGAGAVAAALMMREKVKQHMQKTPEHMLEAVRTAYSGGRIEMSRYGVINQTVYQYDINSAYPSVMKDLPSLANVQWVQGERQSFSLSHIQWDLPETPINPFAYRAPDGRIFYPNKGETYVWEPELAAALKHNKEGITVIETWVPVGGSDVKPFGFIPTLFEQRKQYKKEGNMAEKALKLGINSLYGKTAQQTGGKVVKGVTVAPPFFQLEWAGFITSGTRAKLYDAAMQAPDQIVALATDGIFSLVPLDLPMGDNLGEWEYNEWDSAVFAQSGVYFLKTNGRWISHYRGFDAGTLTVENVSAGLNKGLDSLVARQTRFVTMGLALHTDWSTWRRWVTRDRVLKLHPKGTKRTLEGRNKGIRKTMPSYCVYADQGEVSHPFKIAWLDGLEAMPEAYKIRKEREDMGETE